MAILKCGVSKKDITPNFNQVGDIQVAGYLTMMAPKFKSVHDSIHARAMVLSDDETKIALVSVECIGLLADFIDRVRDRLRAHGYTERQIYIFSTHTHGGPDTMGLWGGIIGKSGINWKYQFFLIDTIVNAILEAEENMKEVEMSRAKSSLVRLVENYRDEKVVTGDLNLLKFMAGKELVSCLWTFSAQPEITTRENLAISGDYPGIVCTKLEEEYGGIALFGLGICGGQAPIYCEQGFEKMELFAKEVFTELQKIFPTANKLDIEPIEIRHRRIEAKLENSDFLLLFTLGIFERELINGAAKTTVSKVRIGNLHLVYLPGEAFPGLFTKTLKENAEKDILFICNANDSIGYLIPIEQYRLKPQVWVDDIENGKFIGHETEAVGLEIAKTIRNAVREIFYYKTIMGIGPHADDLTIWAGGTLKKLTSEGNKLICVRITDDYGDCYGLTKEQGIKKNRKEVEKAYRSIGAGEIVHLDYPTDVLAGVDYLELRGKLIYLIRKYKPDVIVSFDLNGTDEENMDHIVTAQAVNEACWQSSFALYYPEHLEEGLEIHTVGERYLFARNPTIANFHVDITDFVDEKIKAITQQKEVMKNWFFQNKLLARANHLYIELLEEDVPNAIRVNLLVKFVYGETGQKYGVPYAEEFNKIDAGFLEDLASD